jgi:hypothetical protein
MFGLMGYFYILYSTNLDRSKTVHDYFIQNTCVQNGCMTAILVVQIYFTRP